MPTIILIVAATTTALIAGLFYAYSCSVSIGLGRLSNYQYLASMQSINRAILNPMFFLSFLGASLFLPAATVLHFERPTDPVFLLLLTASIVYIAGTFAVTIFGNVPLNEMLNDFDLQAATIEAIAAQRSRFEMRWNRLHTTRTIAAIASLVLVIVACVKKV
jgi:uncharacterized membrane protein